MPASPTFVDGVTPLNATTFNALGAVVDSKLDIPAGSNNQYLKRVSGLWVPANLSAGDLPGYPADATKVLKGDGTWAVPPSADLAYVERITNITINTITEAAPTVILTCPSITLDGATKILIEMRAPCIAWGGSAVAGGISLWEDGVDRGRIFDGTIVGGVAGSFPFAAAREFTPAAGAHVYTTRGWAGGTNMIIQAGAGGVGTPLPMFMRIRRVS